MWYSEKSESPRKIYKNDVTDFKKSVTEFAINNIIDGVKILPPLKIPENVNNVTYIKDLTNYIIEWNLWTGRDKSMEELSKTLLNSNSESAWKFKYLYNNKNKKLEKTLLEISKLSSVEWMINQLKYPWLKNWAKNKLLSEKNFNNVLECLWNYEKLHWNEKPAFLPFYLAYFCYKNKKTKNHNLAIVDFEKPKRSNRFYLINMDNLNIDFCIQCAQWRWYSNKKKEYWVDSTYVKNSNRKFNGVPKVSKENEFSNNPNSYLSSLWCTYTPAPKHWNNWSVWDSLLVQWYEKWFNDNVASRKIYLHWWLSDTNEPSEWCLVIKRTYLTWVLEKMQWWGIIFSYYPDEKYLTNTSSMANLT